MTDLLDQLEQRAHRVDRGDPRAIFRAAVTEADEVRSLQLVDDRGRTRDGRPQRVALAALVACVALIAVGLGWIGRDRDDGPAVADAFPAADIRFGLSEPPEGYELSTVRFAMFDPLPDDVHLMTTVYAPDPQATSSITVLVRRGATFTPDIMMPSIATTEVIGDHEVRITDDSPQLGAPIAAWDRGDGSRVFVIGRGVTVDDVRRAIPGLVIGGDDVATPALLPDGFVQRFAGDGTGSVLAVTGYETFDLQYAPTDGSERQVSVQTVPGADFEPLALRWLGPIVEATVLPDGTGAFRAFDGRAWIKVLPEGLAVIHTFETGPDVDVASLVAQVRPLRPSEWTAIVGDAEVIEGLAANEAVGSAPPSTTTSGTGPGG